MGLATGVIKRITESEFVRQAIEEKADLEAFKRRPSAKVILGVSLIVLSYIIGWPAVSALAALAIYLGEPLVAVIGGPLTYALSHLVFLAGMVLAGAEYTRIFLRWATRVAVEKFVFKHRPSV